MRLFMIRHGQTDWNLERRVQGRTDIPMNETGFYQVRHAALRLTGIHWDCICTSPLLRARESAGVLKEILGVSNIYVIEDLQERELGVLNGVVWDYNERGSLPKEAEGMESQEDAAIRLERVLEKVRNEHAGENVLLVSHGSLLHCWSRRMEREGLIAPLPEDYEFVNASLLPVCFEEGRGYFWDECYFTQEGQ